MPTTILKPQQEITSYRFNDGLTATGTESQNHKYSNPPKFYRESSNLSHPAKLLMRARNEDAGAFDQLIVYVQDRIVAHGAQYNWQLNGRERDLARIAVDEFLNPGFRTDTNKGRMLEISRQAYQKTWGPKVSLILGWLTRWHKEADNCI
ncbi:hypothetical protein [Sessilibacter corallicola]|uniref:hypothetical protein n=1 Tax=Sessilibacter corallicola TaxID=2904075 RepID=UPI001E3EA187|nr:hypothetical protein [Sessilibacter corallicola]MCE2029274.1 hypothetical protein [Sessilibacter corallicola]